ncbi:MAG TPA: TetR family transcriptional regulator [Cellulomonas sp.]
MARIPVEDRRRALVGAAIRVIAREGVPAATTRAIVAEADMPLASFHYAFTSRDELLVAVIEQVTEQERLAAEVRFRPLPGPGAGSGPDAEPGGAPVGAGRPTVEQVVRAGLESYLDLLVAEPLREQALLELSMYALRTPGLEHVVQAQYATYRRAAAATLRSAAEITGAPWTVPEDELAQLLVTVVDGLTTTWLSDHSTERARLTIALVARSMATLADPSG